MIGPVLFAQDPATYLSLAILAGVWFLLFRTTWGWRSARWASIRPPPTPPASTWRAPVTPPCS